MESKPKVSKAQQFVLDKMAKGVMLMYRHDIKKSHTCLSANDWEENVSSSTLF